MRKIRFEANPLLIIHHIKCIQWRYMPRSVGGMVLEDARMEGLGDMPSQPSSANGNDLSSY